MAIVSLFHTSHSIVGFLRGRELKNYVSIVNPRNLRNDAVVLDPLKQLRQSGGTWSWQDHLNGTLFRLGLFWPYCFLIEWCPFSYIWWSVFWTIEIYCRGVVLTKFRWSWAISTLTFPILLFSYFVLRCVAAIQIYCAMHTTGICIEIDLIMYGHAFIQEEMIPPFDICVTLQSDWGSHIIDGGHHCRYAMKRVVISQSHLQ